MSRRSDALTGALTGQLPFKARGLWKSQSGSAQCDPALKELLLALCAAANTKADHPRQALARMPTLANSPGDRFCAL